MASLWSILFKWSNERFIALILNAFIGLEIYYDDQFRSLDVDNVFTLRVLEGALKQFAVEFEVDGSRMNISREMLYISNRAKSIADKAVALMENANTSSYHQFHYILKTPYSLPYNRRHINGYSILDNYPVRSKKINPSSSFNSSRLKEYKCLENLSYNNSTAENMCESIKKCSFKFLNMENKKLFMDYESIDLLLYLAFLQKFDCPLHKIHFEKEMQNLSAKICAITLFDVQNTLRKTHNISLLDTKLRILLIKQVFICGQFGFTQFSSINLLLSMLSWQHPKTGCFLITDNEISIKRGSTKSAILRRNRHRDVFKDSICSTYESGLIVRTLIVLFRFLLDHESWMEFYENIPLSLIENIASENSFRSYEYFRWEKDSLLQLHLMKPPQFGLSLDMVAFFCIFILVFIFRCYSSLFDGKSKRLYHFAYKNL